ncbi:MAG: polysaccharide deacetylase family protein [Wenzhouxiangellaceae bacterium]
MVLLVGLCLAPFANAQKRIALTYDDAPRADGRVFSGDERAEVLIQALRSVRAGPVAFFVTTRGFDRAGGKDRILRYADAGHDIANHTHSHPWAHEITADEFLAEIDRAEAELSSLPNRKPWFRFPFLDEGRDAEKTGTIAGGLAARGLANGYVTVDNYDWHVDLRLQQALRDGKAVDYQKLGRFYVRMMIYAAEYYDGIAVQTLGDSPVHVLLLHENDLAALYADDLVRGFRAAGWEIVSPDTAYDNPLPAPNSLNTGQGRVVGLAADAGRAGHTMWSWAIDEAMIDIQLDRSGAFFDPSETPGCSAPPESPEIVAEGVISQKNRHEFGVSLSRDCQDLLVGIEHGDWQSIEHYRRTSTGWTHIRRVVGTENLSANDPYITPDGQRLYYIRHEGEDTQIAYLDRQGVSSWSEPTILPKPVNTPAREFYVSFDTNANLIFASDRDADGPGDYNLYRARNVDGEYVSVEALPKGINTRWYEADPFIAPDGSYLLFASNRPGGKGRGDIYVAFRDAGTGWSPPRPVDSINTSAHELCPFVSADGETLYYTSDQQIYRVSTSILRALKPAP